MVETWGLRFCVWEGKVVTVGKPGPAPMYRPELADQILKRLADGESLHSICRDPEMPSRPTVYGWVFDNIDGFAAQYARAREIQAHVLADEVTAIADNGVNDWMERNDPDNPGYALNGEHLQRSRLRFDARRWAASKIMPKVYGDKQSVEIEGKVSLEQLIGSAVTAKEPDDSK